MLRRGAARRATRGLFFSRAPASPAHAAVTVAHRRALLPGAAASGAAPCAAPPTTHMSHEHVLLPRPSKAGCAPRARSRPRPGGVARCPGLAGNMLIAGWGRCCRTAARRGGDDGGGERALRLQDAGGGPADVTVPELAPFMASVLTPATPAASLTGGAGDHGRTRRPDAGDALGGCAGLPCVRTRAGGGDHERAGAGAGADAGTLVVIGINVPTA
jgi:hypothetical protein